MFISQMNYVNLVPMLLSPLPVAGLPSRSSKWKGGGAERRAEISAWVPGLNQATSYFFLKIFSTFFCHAGIFQNEGTAYCAINTNCHDSFFLKKFPVSYFLFGKSFREETIGGEIKNVTK